MKTKNLLLTLLMSVVFVLGATNTYADNKKDNKDKKTVVIKADIHCKSCKAKLEKNIPFEKGVRDLKVDMKAKTITVTYRADKNNKANLIKAIEKCGVKVLEGRSLLWKVREQIVVKSQAINQNAVRRVIVTITRNATKTTQKSINVQVIANHASTKVTQKQVQM